MPRRVASHDFILFHRCSKLTAPFVSSSRHSVTMCQVGLSPLAVISQTWELARRAFLEGPGWSMVVCGRTARFKDFSAASQRYHNHFWGGWPTCWPAQGRRECRMKRSRGGPSLHQSFQSCILGHWCKCNFAAKIRDPQGNSQHLLEHPQIGASMKFQYHARGETFEQALIGFPPITWYILEFYLNHRCKILCWSEICSDSQLELSLSVCEVGKPVHCSVACLLQPQLLHWLQKNMGQPSELKRGRVVGIWRHPTDWIILNPASRKASFMAKYCNHVVASIGFSTQKVNPLM